MAEEVPGKTVEVKMQLKRGMKTFRPGTMRLRLNDYLNRQDLPKVPKVFGHLVAAAPPGGWGMLGNDQYGDCVMAGAAHEHMLWAWATHRAIPPFTTSGVVQQYLNQTGGQDLGLDPIKTAFWRQRDGLTDANHVAHKIDAFVQIDTLEELNLAVYMFGAAAFCWALSPTAERQFSQAHVWDDTSQPPDLHDGHYTVCGGMNSKGHYEFLTWGRIQAATPEYVKKYMNPGGCLAYLSKEYLTATDQSPEAINWAALQNALRALA